MMTTEKSNKIEISINLGPCATVVKIGKAVDKAILAGVVKEAIVRAVRDRAEGSQC